MVEHIAELAAERYELEFVTTYQLDLCSESGRVIDSLRVQPNNERYGLLCEIFVNTEARVRNRGIDKAFSKVFESYTGLDWRSRLYRLYT